MAGNAGLPPHAVAGGVAAGGGDRRACVLSQRRPLRDHRRRLCRRAKGSDHAGYLRQDRKGRGARRPAGQERRRAVRNRSGAVPPRRAAGQGHARSGPYHLGQSEGQHQDLRRHGRSDAQGRRLEAARCRPQIDAGQKHFRLAARPRQFVDQSGDRASGAGIRQAADFERENPVARQCRFAARAIPALRAGQGSAGPGRAQPRSHRDAGADGRHRHPGRPDPARAIRDGRRAGVQRDRHHKTLGRRQSEGIGLYLYHRRTDRSTSRSTPSRSTSSRAPSVR